MGFKNCSPGALASCWEGGPWENIHKVTYTQSDITKVLSVSAAQESVSKGQQCFNLALPTSGVGGFSLPILPQPWPHDLLFPVSKCCGIFFFIVCSIHKRLLLFNFTWESHLENAGSLEKCHLGIKTHLKRKFHLHFHMALMIIDTVYLIDPAILLHFICYKT